MAIKDLIEKNKRSEKRAFNELLSLSKEKKKETIVIYCLAVYGSSYPFQICITFHSS